MAKARLKPEVFKRCECAVLEREDFISTWDGGKANLLFECEIRRNAVMVCMNGFWWKVDPIDWEISEFYGCTTYRKRGRYERLKV